MAIRLLIVEKDGEIAELARRALAFSEWRVATEDDPEKALFGVSAVTPDLVVCASDLGAMTGGEFLRRVRDIGVAAHLPFVLVGGDEGADGAFWLPSGTEPAEFSNALYDALADIDIDEEEMAEAIELDEAPGARDLAEVAELSEVAGDALDLSTAAEGLDLLESIELPEDEGFFLLEPTELVSEEAGAEAVPPEAAVQAGELLPEAPECTETEIFAVESEPQPEPPEAEPLEDETESAIPGADGETIAAVEEDFTASQFAVSEVDEETLEIEPVQPELTPEANKAAEVGELGSDAREAVRLAVLDAVGKTLNPEALAGIIAASVEKIVWEVVPPLAEKLILEAIEKLKNPPEPT